MKVLDTGRLLTQTLYSDQLKKDMTLRIWLPLDYDATNHPYDVLYMHDGQNLFDQATSAYGHIWQVDQAIKYLSSPVPPCMVVGIDCSPGLDRLHEYSPWVSDKVKELKALTDWDGPIGGKGKIYADFIVNTVKPYIDAHFKTNPAFDHTHLAGSSMGGLISIYMGLAYPQVFKSIGAFSTAAWFAQDQVLDFINQSLLNPKQKWYFDVGTNETSNPDVSNFNDLYVDGTQAIYDLFVKKGLSTHRLKLVIDQGGIHNEEAWAKRLPGALEFLLA